jgi:hypothetical protein
LANFKDKNLEVLTARYLELDASKIACGVFCQNLGGACVVLGLR